MRPRMVPRRYVASGRACSTGHPAAISPCSSRAFRCRIERSTAAARSGLLCMASPVIARNRRIER